MYSKNYIKKVVSEGIIGVTVLAVFLSTIGYYRHMISDVIGVVVVVSAVIVVCGRISVLAGYLIYRRKKMEIAKHFLVMVLSISVVYIINLHVTHGIFSDEAMEYGVYYALGLCAGDVVLRLCVEVKRMLVQHSKK